MEHETEKSPETKEEQLTNGLILAGNTCPWGNDCNFSSTACNGQGCPIANGKVYDKNFSCGAARFYEAFGMGID